MCTTISVVVDTFPRPFRDLSTCLNFEIARHIKIPTTEAIESNDLNIENLYIIILLTLKVKVKNVFVMVRVSPRPFRDLVSP